METEQPISRSVGGHQPSLLRASTRISSAVVAVAYPLTRGREAISRLTHTGAYVLAYGVVYTPWSLLGRCQENPVMHGFRDGGQAAPDEPRAD
jgi:hypothetical protein